MLRSYENTQISKVSKMVSQSTLKWGKEKHLCIRILEVQTLAKKETIVVELLNLLVRAECIILYFTVEKKMECTQNMCNKLLYHYKYVSNHNTYTISIPCHCKIFGFILDKYIHKIPGKQEMAEI